MVFPFNRTELLRKRKDNSSVTRFACATFPTREGTVAAPRPCHCEPARTLVWQSRTKYHPFSSRGEKIPTALRPQACTERNRRRRLLARSSDIGHCLGMTIEVSLRTSAHAGVAILALPARNDEGRAAPWPPYRGSQSKARLGSLCVPKLHNGFVE